MGIRILLLTALNPDHLVDGNLPIYDDHLILSDCAKISKDSGGEKSSRLALWVFRVCNCYKIYTGAASVRFSSVHCLLRKMLRRGLGERQNQRASGTDSLLMFADNCTYNT